MHPNETRVFLAVLTGVIVIILFIAFFIASAIRHQKQNVEFRLSQLNLEINALEKERFRIASDLHDDFGSSLSAIRLQLQYLKTHEQDALKAVDEAQSYIDEAIQKLRHIAFNMMPRILDRNGLPDAITELTDIIEYTSGIKINCQCSIDPDNKDKRIHIYRIIQEILSNVVKHSKATAVEISIKKSKELILLKVSDNGIGFDKDANIKNSTGQGLKNIKSRVEVLKAKIYLSSSPGEGVNYLIEILDTNDNEC